MNTIPVFYGAEMTADSESYSPSAAKPALVVADWQARKLPVALIAPCAIETNAFYLAHDKAHVDAILAGEKPNGFGNLSPSVAASLPYTTGAMFEAARCAIANGKVACAPVSGFHHAGWDFTGGFCTFNGLMVTALQLQRMGLLNRVAILDLDMHYGNGTENIIERLQPLTWGVQHYSQSRYPSEAEQFLEDLPIIIKKWTEFGEKPDLLLYQAGADSHIDDPLGGYLTTEQMRRRDHIVFRTCRALEIPVAWNLAGGYQRDAQGGIEPVLALHRATMEECAAAFVTAG